jgi:hypothetical protein
MDYDTQFRDLASFIIAALWVYTQQASQLRSWVESQAGREAF